MSSKWGEWGEIGESWSDIMSALKVAQWNEGEPTLPLLPDDNWKNRSLCRERAAGHLVSLEHTSSL